MTLRILLDMVIGFISLGFVEAVVKPMAKRVVKRKILLYAPLAMEYLDKKIPGGFVSGEELQNGLINWLEERTGEEWRLDETEEFFHIYDPRITADKTL